MLCGTNQRAIRLGCISYSGLTRAYYDAIILDKDERLKNMYWTDDLRHNAKTAAANLGKAMQECDYAKISELTTDCNRLGEELRELVWKMQQKINRERILGEHEDKVIPSRMLRNEFPPLTVHTVVTNSPNESHLEIARRIGEQVRASRDAKASSDENKE